MTEEIIPQIEEIVTDGELAKSIFESAKISMGQDITEIDSVLNQKLIYFYIQCFTLFFKAINL